MSTNFNKKHIKSISGKSVNAKTTRTRSHIIADLSINHTEKFAFLEGYATQEIKDDYGYDLNIYTFDSDGQFENGNIFIQLKASDKPKYSKKNLDVSFSIRTKHIKTWFDEPMPILLVFYDAKRDLAYWIYLQQHLRKLLNFDIDKLNKSYTVRIPISNLLDHGSMAKFRNYKLNILNQTQNVVTYK